MRLASFCGPRGNIQSLAVSEKQVEAWPGAKIQNKFQISVQRSWVLQTAIPVFGFCEAHSHGCYIYQYLILSK